MAEYRVRYSFDYTQPILSCAVSPEAGTVAVGMASGLLTVRARNLKNAGEKAMVVAKRAPRAGTYHYFVRGQREVPPRAPRPAPPSSRPERPNCV